MRGIERLRGIGRRVLGIIGQPIVLIATCVVVAALLLTGYTLEPTVQISLDTAQIRSDPGTMNSVRLQDRQWLVYRIEGDTLTRHRASRLMLFEDGRPLGPAHQIHDAIRTDGHGRFSHWGRYLFFSTSDNSAPSSNNRHYTATVNAKLDTRLYLLGGIIVFLAYVRLRHIEARTRRFKANEFGTSEFIPLLALVAAMFVINRDIFIITGLKPFIYDDSLSYFVSPNIRGYLYKGVIEIGSALFTGPAWFVVLQLNAILMSFLALGYAVGRITASLLLGWLTAFVLIFNFEMIKFAPTVLGEPLFIAFLALHLAASLEAIRTGSVGMAAVSGACIALAALIRPAGLGMFAGLLVIALVRSDRRLRIGSAAFAAALVVHAAGAIPNKISVGVFSTHAFGGFAILGHVIHLARHDTPTEHPDLLAAILEKAGPFDKFDSAKYPEEYWKTTVNNYNTLLWRIAGPELTAYANRSVARDDKLAAMTLMNEVALSLAFSIIRDEPLRFARHVAAQLYGSWYQLFTSSASIGAMVDYQVTRAHQSKISHPAFTAFVDQEEYPDSETLAQWEAAPDWELTTEYVSSEILPILRGTIAALPIVTIGFLLFGGWSVLAGRQMGLAVMGAVFCAFQIWAYFGFVALAQPALLRYSSVAAPQTTTFIVLLLAITLSCAKKFIAGGAGSPRSKELSSQCLIGE